MIEIYLSDVGVLDNIVIDLCPLINRLENQYNIKYTLR